MKRRFSILTALIGAGATWPVVLVVAGLLSVPSSCLCGSSLPHDHALFVLSTHQHDTADHDTRRTTLETDQHRVTIQELTTSTLGESHAVALVTSLGEHAGETTSALNDTAALPHGRQVHPATPPPRA